MTALKPDALAEYFRAVYGYNLLDATLEDKKKLFTEFFRAVYDYDPFPWQARLAARVCGVGEASPKEGKSTAWPRCIALPTASGKTACIDIAVFALACQASLPPQERTAPRRIFFVVDRRVVVDQAYDHGKDLAEKLDWKDDRMLWTVAETLRSVSRSGWRELPETDRRRILDSRCKWKYEKSWKAGEREQFWKKLRPDEREWIDISPLDVYALRGGMYRESAWVRSPLQPTVITSTVDQVGSRLLFRGYGVSDSSKPLHAALVGNDALILLDEAHCARPFDQTMTLVRKYREWTDQPKDRLKLPFHFVTMTATPTAGAPMNEIERLGKDDREHPVLGKRITANKPARLVLSNAKGDKWEKWGPVLAKDLADHATSFQKRGFLGIGVIVNRVATARKVAELLRAPLQRALDAARAEPDAAKRQAMESEARINAPDVILLTGRMRPVDRDAIMAKLEPLFSKNSNKEGGEMKPTFVVATQTIEVGADLDFHALVTECASLDALRQRFGRLNRVAARDKAEAVIVVREDQTKPVDEETKADPVYGNGLAKTWQWLNKHDSNGTPDPTDPPLSGDEPRAKKERRKGKGSDSPASASAAKIIDFGVAALDALLNDPKTRPDDLAALNAPSPDAAVLLPAHLDMWCQTSPRPVPDPDPSYFLHGPQRGEPEVQVVFRADLGADEAQWAEVVSLCPPSSSEALSVRLRDFTRWLKGKVTDETSSDVEGQRVEDSSEADDENADSTPALRRALRWRGPDARETSVVRGGERATPNDLFVVPITTNDQRIEAALLGDFPINDDGTPRITDAGDEAFQRSRDKAILRIRHALYPQLDAAGDATDFVAHDDEEVEGRIDEALKTLSAHSSLHVQRAAEALGVKRNRAVELHPLGGLVLIGKRRLHLFDPTFIDPEDSWEAASDRPYPLADHCRDVAGRAGQFADCCGLPGLAPAINLAGELHDIGKADLRFQAWLNGGNARRAAACATLYAKSVVPVRSRSELLAFRDRARYPAGARHELYSTWMAAHPANSALAGIDPALHDLVLHLIASHHGYGRPFAPIATGDLDRVKHTAASNGMAPLTIPRAAEPFTFAGDGRTLTFTPDSSISGHGLERLDSGVAERFWMLTRRYGWWGLPYLEALLRLADWACGDPLESTGAISHYAASDGRAQVVAAALPEAVS